jgi:hypothetical protein
MGFKVYNDRRVFRELRVSEPPTTNPLGFYTQQQVGALINDNVGYNVLNYGADNTGLTNTTATIQAAIDAVHALPEGGMVRIPRGMYLVDTINTYLNVAIVGDGYNVTTLKSASAVTMLSMVNADLALDVGYPCAPIMGLKLDGNFIGTTGLFVFLAAYFYPRDLAITNFVSDAVRSEGMLLSAFTNCLFWGNFRGVTLTRNEPAAQPVPANLIAFNDCTFNGNAQWAVECHYGAHIAFNGVDFEHNGTQGDPLTGCVRHRNGGWDGTNNGILYNRGWLEQNKGTAFLIDEPLQNMYHSIRDVKIIDGNQPTVTMENAIKMTATGAYKNVMEINGCNIDTVNQAVVLVGANAIIQRITSDLPAPATATSPGFKGEIRYVGADVYRCIAENTWVKQTMATF